MQQMISDNKKNLSSSSVSDNIEQQGGEEEKGAFAEEKN